MLLGISPELIKDSEPQMVVGFLSLLEKIIKGGQVDQWTLVHLHSTR